MQNVDHRWVGVVGGGAHRRWQGGAGMPTNRYLAALHQCGGSRYSVTTVVEWTSVTGTWYTYSLPTVAVGLDGVEIWRWVEREEEEDDE